MKKNNSLILLIALAVVAVLIKGLILDKGPSGSDNQGAIEAIMTRSSVRSYTNQPVEAEKIETMLRAAMAAPTAMNRQPWSFYVVENRELLDQMGATLKNSKMLGEAPLAIVVCGDMNLAAVGVAREFWIQDTSAATENLLLAAHSLGLGAVWTGVHPIPEKLSAVKKFLSLPATQIPLCVVAIGYPDTEAKIKEKWDESKVQYIK